jgi:probable HAF family extracellular repeat protein
MRHFSILVGLSTLTALLLLEPIVSESASFQWIGGATADAVSADGKVVLGARRVAGGTEAFRWTAPTGIVGLGDLPGGALHSVPTAVSSDGSAVVGWGHWGSNLQTDIEAFHWTQSTGMVGLGDIAGIPASALLGT